MIKNLIACLIIYFQTKSVLNYLSMISVTSYVTNEFFKFLKSINY